MINFYLQCTKCGSFDVELSLKDVDGNLINTAIGFTCNDCGNEEYIKEDSSIEKDGFDPLPILERADISFNLLNDEMEEVSGLSDDELDALESLV